MTTENTPKTDLKQAMDNVDAADAKAPQKPAVPLYQQRMSAASVKIVEMIDQGIAEAHQNIRSLQALREQTIIAATALRDPATTTMEANLAQSLEAELAKNEAQS